ncbi:MAG: GNAT family N-acetyltransferase [Candidatus Thorarchaeota archaeon]|nr:GNAT family N-acetyltransferase [Candidatus Thorarchaeota archaeon]
MDFVTRRLLKSDIPAIIELTKKTWGGHDHLPLIIGSWLTNRQCHPMVLELKGEVVAVANLKAIDNELTGWMEGLRVHPKVREKGLAKYMTNQIVETASEIGFKRIRLVTATENPAPRKLALSVGMNIIDKYSIFWKRYGRGIKWIKDDESISRIDRSLVLGFIKSNPELFPTNSLVHHWDVFEANQENISLISEEATFFISNSVHGRGLSWGFKHDTRQGSEWCFSVYASSPDVFESTLHFHLKQAREHDLKDMLCIHQPEFNESYSKVKWLKRRGHEIGLLLFERVL